MQRNLKQHTVKSFDESLGNISNLMLEMSNLTLESVNIIEEVIKTKKDLANKIKSHDDKINQYDYDIGNEIAAFIALRQPKAYDLRLAVSAVKVSSNLERIGDYAKGVVEKISKYNVSKKYEKNFLTMTAISKDMIKNAVYSLTHNDLEASQLVLAKDDEIDGIYREMLNKFKNQTLSEDSRELINMIFVAKGIERLADHAGNIATIVNYTVTGEII